ncbi:MAG: hypothetical protein C0631_00380 [Sedimenticola sp.]|nr:MAG: hypothetical protein C0631_00380 [Sedimenticola sp.]
MLTRPLLMFLLPLLCLLWVPAALTATPATNLQLVAAVSESISAADIEERLKELEAVAEKDAATTKAIELYRESLGFIKQAGEDRLLAASYKAAIDEAPQRLKQMQDDLESAKRLAQQEPKVDGDQSLTELEQLYAQIAADLQVAVRKVTVLEEQAGKERLRPELSGSDLSAARKKLEELEAKSKVAITGDDVEGRARQIHQTTSLDAIKSRINRLEMERLSYAPRQEQMALTLERERELSKQIERRQQALQTLLNQRRSAEVEKARQETQLAQQEVHDKHPLLRDAAQLNAGLSEQLARASREIDKVILARESVSSQLKLVQQNLDRIQQQLDIVGLDAKLGMVLRKQRQELPDLNRIEERISQRRQEISEARLVQFQIEEQRQQLLIEEQEAAALGAVRLPDMNSEERQTLTTELAKLLSDRRDLLDKLKTVYSRYESELSDIILDRLQLSDKVDQYGRLLDRHLVWTPSTGRMDLSTFGGALLTFGWFLSADNWMSAVNGMIGSATQNPVRTTLLVLLVLALFRARKRLMAVLEEISQSIGNVTRDSFFLTVKATVYTFLLALPWVILVAMVALLLVRSDPEAFIDAVAVGVRRIAVFFLLMQLLRYFFVQHGLAEAHFRWKAQTITIYRRNLNWLVPLLMPLVFIVGITEWQLDEAYKNTLGRLAYLVSVLLVGVFFHRVLNPWSGVIRREAGQDWRPSLLWYPLAMGFCLLLFGLAFEGYYFSALTLESLLFWSIIIASGSYFIYNLSIRWVLVTDRRLAFSRALAKRQAALEARAAKEASGGAAGGEGIPDIHELEEVKLAAISEQTRRILHIIAFASAVVVLGLLWAQLMPALAKLDDLVLWEHLGGSGQVVPVSLWDGIMAILVFGLTLAAGRNLPGLLEFALLQPLSLSAGNRYAISMISSYVIYGTGTFAFFSMVGMSWGDVQWLVAAMGVGLGFGLKEIFSSFFSGLILLFERPLRVGDTVTVGDISGTVSRIRMRATTITDWDNKELVVPNVKFLTDALVNWTLTDTVTRVVIKVGIAYGSDAEQAYQVIRDTVVSRPDVMQEPPPAVFFVGFGDSSLDYSIYVFVNDRSKRLPVTHDIHISLHKALKAAGIEIPFPQRDLHLRSVDPALAAKFSDPGERPD